VALVGRLREAPNTRVHSIHDERPGVVGPGVRAPEGDDLGGGEVAGLAVEAGLHKAGAGQVLTEHLRHQARQ
jgi:N-acetylglutamate synthase-like GNAT family acetyltransferase